MKSLLLLLSLIPSVALSADTVEVWDQGAADVDLYFGFDGVGLERTGRSLYGDLMLGYGLTSRFSVYLGTTVVGDQDLETSDPDLYFGLFGTLIETDHFDLDLFLDVRAVGMAELKLTPSTELNFDLDPKMQTFGFYLRLALCGQTQENLKVFVFNPGVYLTLAEGHQLLLEYDMSINTGGVITRRSCPPGITAIGGSSGIQRRTIVGGTALGYNLVLSDTIELITQVAFDIPQESEKGSVSVMVGMIATIPSSAGTGAS